MVGVCLLVMASRVMADPLVIGANRDERANRPAVPMAVLQAAGPRVLGGRDLLAGGTWLAVNQHGVVAGLTNTPRPEGRDPGKRSRGLLPVLAARHPTAERAVEALIDEVDPSDFNPGWMLVGDRSCLFAVTIAGDRPSAAALPPGIHVLENHPPGVPSGKVEHVLDLLGPWAAGGDSAPFLDRLRTVLADHSRPDPAPEGRPPYVMSACVHGEDYGTRSSAIIAVPADEARLPSIAVADGAPCRAPFVPAERCWHEDVEPVARSAG